MLPGRKPQPLESDYLATVFARHDTSISYDGSDQRTQAMVCWLRREEMESMPGRDGSIWDNYLLWLISIIATATPLAVAIWQDDWWMKVFGAWLVLDAILRTAYAIKANMTYKIDFPGQDSNETTVARYGDRMCLIAGSAAMVKAACRSRVIGDVVPRYLAIALAVSSVLQLLGNLIAVPNGGAYAILAYLGTIGVSFLIQVCLLRLRTRVGPDHHRVICSVLATKAEAVAFMAYLLGKDCESLLRGLELLNRDDISDAIPIKTDKQASQAQIGESSQARMGKSPQVQSGASSQAQSGTFSEAQSAPQDASIETDSYSEWWRRLRKLLKEKNSKLTPDSILKLPRVAKEKFVHDTDYRDNFVSLKTWSRTGKKSLSSVFCWQFNKDSISDQNEH